jgi:hypothetical protein
VNANQINFRVKEVSSRQEIYCYTFSLSVSVQVFQNYVMAHFKSCYNPVFTIEMTITYIPSVYNHLETQYLLCYNVVTGFYHSVNFTIQNWPVTTYIDYDTNTQHLCMMYCSSVMETHNCDPSGSITSLSYICHC